MRKYIWALIGMQTNKATETRWHKECVDTSVDLTARRYNKSNVTQGEGIAGLLFRNTSSIFRSLRLSNYKCKVQEKAKAK